MLAPDLWEKNSYEVKFCCYVIFQEIISLFQNENEPNLSKSATQFNQYKQSGFFLITIFNQRLYSHIILTNVINKCAHKKNCVMNKKRLEFKLKCKTVQYS